MSGAAGGAGAAGLGGAAGASGAAGAAGSSTSCDFSTAPADAECAYDSDCEVPKDQAECAFAHCDSCKTWTCQIKPKNVGFGCTSPSGDKCKTATCSPKGTCVDGPAKTCTPPDSCSTSSCNPSNGQCEIIPKDDDTACSDGDSCFSNKVCKDGVCQGGDPKCKGDACREATCSFGFCSYVPQKPLPGTCDDGNSCTKDDFCIEDASEGAKCIGVPIKLDCTSLDTPCSVGACVPKTGECGATAKAEGASCEDGYACTKGDTCQAGQCIAKDVSLEHVFYEDFSDNKAGWTLEGEWAIGKAVGSSPSPSTGFDDPSVDATPNNDDNGVAGVALGGSGVPDLTVGDAYYLTSPEIDLTATTGDVYLSFQRWLNTDWGSYMAHTIDGYDGTAWVSIWKNPANQSLGDKAWTPQTFNISALKSSKFRVRFGTQVLKKNPLPRTSWNLDELTIGSPACENTGGAGGAGGAGGTAGGAGMSGGAGQAGMSGAGGASGAGGMSGASGAGGMSGASGAGAMSGAGGAGGDAGASGAGGSTQQIDVASCTYASATDKTAAGGVVVQQGLSYKPPCIRIKAGQTVTFTGDFVAHPLAGMVVNGTQPNPVAGPYMTDPVVIKFDAPGSYGYYCVTHGADDIAGQTGMSGAVYVDP
jgi:plastocyanin